MPPLCLLLFSYFNFFWSFNFAPFFTPLCFVRSFKGEFFMLFHTSLFSLQKKNKK
ncbi:hypothetical protein BDV26DRAFT_130788 [Aspergillus bertholletiae]|uniref:Uncharacterized protein n=1 Tax=Aspergillus bertholletiae TaxID=1226010 RepID=A0A5N7BFF4_9EURO|nr:hypothetical protein BDV26DRAFT_130788 [Aspergillus bertholletiae]